MLGEALLAFEVMSYGSEVEKIGTKDVTQKLLEDYNALTNPPYCVGDKLKTTSCRHCKCSFV